MLTHVGEDLPRPHPRDGPMQRPQNFGTSYMRALGMGNNNQILHGQQTRRYEGNFYRVDSRMLTRVLFAVANLLVFVNINLYNKSDFWMPVYVNGSNF